MTSNKKNVKDMLSVGLLKTNNIISNKIHAEFITVLESLSSNSANFESLSVTNLNITDTITQNLFNDNVKFGSGCLNKTLTGTSNIAFGLNCLSSLTTGSSNTASGTLCLNQMSTGEMNCAFGYNSGINDLEGNLNSYFGSNTGQVSDDINIYNNSTAIGANSIINESNQITIGTNLEKINIPGSVQQLNYLIEIPLAQILSSSVITSIVNTGTYTLADPTIIGFKKIISNSTNTASVTVSALYSNSSTVFTTINFTTAYQSVELLWIGTYWQVLNFNGTSFLA